MQHANDGTASDIDILYEDDVVLVINKPAGLIVHSDGRTEEPSVADWVIEHYPQLADVGEPWTSPQGEAIPRPGIVHRLDRTTTGVMVLAKTQAAFVNLKKQFQERSIEKHYDALVYGHVKEDRGIIELEIGRTKKKPRKWIAHHVHGTKRAAVTHWRAVARFVDPETGERITHVDVSPKTGRTHQIRVHFQAVQHPLVCDHLYAPKRACILGLERPALHARTITFVPPGSRERQTVEAPLPADLTSAFSRLNSGEAT